MQSTRRGFLRVAGLAGAAVGMAACTAPGAETSATSAAPQPSGLKMPTSPVTLNLVDVWSWPSR